MNKAPTTEPAPGGDQPAPDRNQLFVERVRSAGIASNEQRTLALFPLVEGAGYRLRYTRGDGRFTATLLIYSESEMINKVSFLDQMEWL